MRAPSLSDYDASVSCKDDLGATVTTSGTASPWSLSLASGRDVICTITNTRKKGSVKLVKDIVPVDEQLGDPGKFDLTIDGQGSYGATKSDAGDGDSVTATVPTGDVDLSEVAGTNTSLSDYTSTYSCSAPGHTDVTGSGIAISDLAVASGDSWVCTITNTRKKGTVKLVKDIVPVDDQLGDPGKFDLTIDGEGSYGATKSDAGDGDSVTATVRPARRPQRGRGHEHQPVRLHEHVQLLGAGSHGRDRLRHRDQRSRGRQRRFVGLHDHEHA